VLALFLILQVKHANGILNPNYVSQLPLVQMMSVATISQTTSPISMLRCVHLSQKQIYIALQMEIHKDAKTSQMVQIAQPKLGLIAIRADLKLLEMECFVLSLIRFVQS
jgi:hypothetical protein